MKSTTFLLTVNGALLAAALGNWLWPRPEIEVLRRELAGLKAEAGEAARWREENRRLTAVALPEAEMARLRAERAALPGLRAEAAGVAAQRSGPGPKPETTSVAKGAPADPPAPAGAGPVRPAGEWKNTGRLTPTATLETLLWAAAGGDLETLASTCWIPPAARAKAQSLLDSLPEAQRANYGTPEQLVAALTLAQVPVGAMQVVKVETSVNKDSPTTETSVIEVRLKSAEGGWQEKTLILFRNTTADAGWRFSVPVSAVESYLATLKAPATTAAGTGGK